MKFVQSLFLAGLILSGVCFSVPAHGAVLDAETLKVLREGEPARIADLLKRGLDVNARDAHGNTALMLVTMYGDTAGMRLLLERGADVNAGNQAGATALMRAAANYEKTRLLLKHGAEVNARSAFGNTALLLAARPADSFRTVELLLKHGAKASATNEFGASALMAAAAGGDDRTVRLLLKHGVDPNAPVAATEPGFLFGGGRNALTWAAYRGDVKIIKLLLDAGADVNGESLLGTPLSQAAWADQTEAARLLIERGARPNQTSRMDGFSPLHWAASTEGNSAELVQLLLQHGADPNLGGGDPIDAYMDVAQTPLMLARRRGENPTVAALLAGGATNQTPDRVRSVTPPDRDLPEKLNRDVIQAAMAAAIAPLQETAIQSKKEFVRHNKKQDCTSCHQQYLPMAAVGAARKRQVPVDAAAERELIDIVARGELKNFEVNWQALFHPDPVFTKGYTLLGYDLANVAADENADSAVHHLAAIQGRDGRWFNNLPRPPIQSGDIAATALAIHALQKYPLPGRKAELAQQVERARRWLWSVTAENTEGRVYQLLGLCWAGEPATKLQRLAQGLVEEQRQDGGWGQLRALNSDAYATGQSLYALGVAAKLKNSHPALERGRHYLLGTQLADGTWHVRRRAFPFQPTMRSGFPHGRDSWISAAATSWAVMALSLEDEPGSLAAKAR